ncbi:MAG: transposase [Bdellovibrionales bacterium]|nr:transposase [Bdellovibrionales bacterium]
MSSKRRVFSEEYKAEAIDLAEKMGTTKASQDLGINPANIRRWKIEAQSGRAAASGAKTYEELELEVRELRKENEYLNKVSDVLKKSLGIISKDQMRNSK